MKYGLITFFLYSIGCFMAAAVAHAEEEVRFRGPPYPHTKFALARAERQGKTLEPKLSDEVVGYLSKPEGDGPFPAVVLMHGCDGRGAWNDLWRDRLISWGYVVLDVDSFKTRGVSGDQVCFAHAFPGPATRAFDAQGAKSLLSKLDYVDAKRMAVIGMSHGGASAMQSVESSNQKKFKFSAFQAAVALYPFCGSKVRIGAELLILIGGTDNWTPADNCRRLLEAQDSQDLVSLQVYPGAYHGFDVPGIDEKIRGQFILRYNKDADTDTMTRVKEFLAKTLN